MVSISPLMIAFFVFLKHVINHFALIWKLAIMQLAARIWSIQGGVPPDLFEQDRNNVLRKEARLSALEQECHLLEAEFEQAERYSFTSLSVTLLIL